MSRDLKNSASCPFVEFCCWCFSDKFIVARWCEDKVGASGRFAPLPQLWYDTQIYLMWLEELTGSGCHMQPNRQLNETRNHAVTTSSFFSFLATAAMMPWVPIPSPSLLWNWPAFSPTTHLPSFMSPSLQRLQCYCAANEIYTSTKFHVTISNGCNAIMLTRWRYLTRLCVIFLTQQNTRTQLTTVWSVDTIPLHSRCCGW